MAGIADSVRPIKLQGGSGSRKLPAFLPAHGGRDPVRRRRRERSRRSLPAIRDSRTVFSEPARGPAL